MPKAVLYSGDAKSGYKESCDNFTPIIIIVMHMADHHFHVNAFPFVVYQPKCIITAGILHIPVCIINKVGVSFSKHL